MLPVAHEFTAPRHYDAEEEVTPGSSKVEAEEFYKVASSES